MSLDGVQPSAPFLPSPGKPAVDWHTWEGKFNNYLLPTPAMHSTLPVSVLCFYTVWEMRRTASMGLCFPA